MLSSEDDLKKMNESETQKEISILKCPRFWQISTDTENSKTNFSKGRVNYNVQWAYLYGNYCEMCKRKNEDVQNCKHNCNVLCYVRICMPVSTAGYFHSRTSRARTENKPGLGEQTEQTCGYRQFTSKKTNNRSRSLINVR